MRNAQWLRLHMLDAMGGLVMVSHLLRLHMLDAMGGLVMVSHFLHMRKGDLCVVGEFCGSGIEGLRFHRRKWVCVCVCVCSMLFALANRLWARSPCRQGSADIRKSPLTPFNRGGAG